MALKVRWALLRLSGLRWQDQTAQTASVVWRAVAQQLVLQTLPSRLPLLPLMLLAVCSHLWRQPVACEQMVVM